MAYFRHLALALLVLMVGLIINGCSTPESLEPQSPVSPLSSPLGTVSTLPTPVAVTPFIIDGPLRSGDTVVTGRGPEGTRILIGDVTYMGETIGSGTIDDNGRFEITVSPLIANHRVGILLDPAFEDQYPVMMLDNIGDYFGDSGMMVPQVGAVLDSAMVQP